MTPLSVDVFVLQKEPRISTVPIGVPSTQWHLYLSAIIQHSAVLTTSSSLWSVKLTEYWPLDNGSGYLNTHCLISETGCGYFGLASIRQLTEAYWRHMASWNLVNTGPGNGLLSDHMLTASVDIFILRMPHVKYWIFEIPMYNFQCPAIFALLDRFVSHHGHSTNNSVMTLKSLGFIPRQSSDAVHQADSVIMT